MAQNPIRRRVAGLLIIATAGAVAVSIGMRLRSYGVPIGLITPCVLAVLSSALWLLMDVSKALASTVHRCTVKGCTFEVRVQNADAAESRRWQEIAAAHPNHPTV
ncbi:hypothetical protein ACQB60_18160 [Actinomycetota bacterium Odt1-20B]